MRKMFSEGQIRAIAAEAGGGKQYYHKITFNNTDIEGEYYVRFICDRSTAFTKTEFNKFLATVKGKAALQDRVIYSAGAEWTNYLILDATGNEAGTAGSLSNTYSLSLYTTWYATTFIDNVEEIQ